MFKKIIILVIVLVSVLLTSYLIGVYQNNRDVPFPQKAQVQQQLEVSIQWLVDHQTEALSQVTPMLWWMLHEVHSISQDERVGDLLEKYHQQHQSIKTSAWGPLFDGLKQRHLGAYAVQTLPYYNQHFIYALNCAADLENEISVVAEQNTAGFCHQSAYFYRPACITHQLMGINFLHTKQCGFLSDIDEVRQSLQLDIVGQLTWDIRVVDVYLQRVLMLLITGAQESVKPIWIQQVLDHQLPDGGWSGFVSLLGSDTGRSLGFSSKVVSLGSEKSNFHTTAQGVYILTYLLSNKS